MENLLVRGVLKLLNFTILIYIYIYKLILLYEINMEVSSGIIYSKKYMIFTDFPNSDTLFIPIKFNTIWRIID